MDKTRGGPSDQRAVVYWLATNVRAVCDANNGRPSLERAFREVLVYVHSTCTCTEKQCSNSLTQMLRVTRGIVCPECTPKASVAKAAVYSDVETAKAPLAYSFKVMPAIRSDPEELCSSVDHELRMARWASFSFHEKTHLKSHT